MAIQTQGKNFWKNALHSFNRAGGSSGPAARAQAHVRREHAADPNDGAEDMQSESKSGHW